MTEHRAVPTVTPDRILALDALRGFAVLGILIMNVQSFAMPMPAYLNPTAFGSLDGADWWIWVASNVFADRKFISIFSMLFGAGLLLFAEHASARGGAPVRLHYRRMAWLFVFGMVHSYLLWYGDILVSYAVCGMLVFLFRRRSPRTLLITGLLVMSVGSGLYLFFGWSMRFWPPEALRDLLTQTWQPSPETIAQEVAIYRGGWLAQMEHRVPQTFFMQVQFLPMYELWRAGGLMLVGMALYRWGVLTGQRSAAFYRGLAATGLLVGLPLASYGVWRNVAAGWDIHYSFFFGPQWNYWAGLLVALGYCGVAMLACRSRTLASATSRLAAVGRMAFTNYLLQTVICTTLFYGHGFGLYGRVPRTGQALIVLAIWLALLIASPIWLRHFHFGPLEWLWRALTYGTPPPFRRTAA